MYRLTETEKKAPDYSYTEEFETQEEAYNRMMDLYHSFAIDTDANAVVTAIYFDNSAFVEYTDGNVLNWNIEEV